MFGGNTSIWKFVAFCEKASACSFSTLGNKAYIWKSATKTYTWKSVTIGNLERRIYLKPSYIWKQGNSAKFGHKPFIWKTATFGNKTSTRKPATLRTGYLCKNPVRLETRHLCENPLRLGTSCIFVEPATFGNKASMWKLATLGKGGIQLKFRYGEEQGIYLIHLKACEGGNKAALWNLDEFGKINRWKFQRACETAKNLAVRQLDCNALQNPGRPSILVQQQNVGRGLAGP